MHTHQVTLWPVLRWADHDLLRRVEKFFVFNEGESALLFTQDLRVYAVGKNEFGCLGIGTITAVVTKPEEIVELRGVQIEICKANDKHVMVITKDQVLYGWGRNVYGQIGCGNRQPQSRPVAVMTGVIMVACGWWHTAALRNDGTVWCWGSNDSYQLGLIYREGWNEPRKITLLQEYHVVYIECGVASCVAITKESEIFLWGDYASAIPEEEPLLSQFSLASVTTGSFHIIGLTVDGHIRTSRIKPEFEVNTHEIDIDEPVLSVTYVPFTKSQYFLKLKSGRVTMVNLVGSNKRMIRTQLTSVADACALYSTFPGTPTLTSLPTNAVSEEAMQSISHFNNPTTSNLTLWIATNRIYLNTEIASQRSPYLAKQIAGPWKNKPYVELHDHSFVVYFTYLQYVHCGTVGVIEPEWACELLQLTLKAKEASLHGHCLHVITTHMPNGAAKMVRSKHWSSLMAQLESSLSIASIVCYLDIAEKTENAELESNICKLVSTLSHSIADKVMAELLQLSQSTTTTNA